MLDKNEIKYIFYSVTFAVAFFYFILPNFITSIEKMSPYLQFLIFNIGLFVLLQIFLRAKATDTKFIKNPTKTVGIILFIISIDILLPPFLVGFDGNLPNGDVMLKASSSDYIIGYFAINTLNLTGFTVFLFTYVLIPVSLLIISSYLVPNLLREV